MSSNSKRTKQQLFAVPAALAAMAVVTWPVSYVAAQSTGWVSAPAGTFGDFWMGALAVMTFLGAAGTTFGAAISTLDGINKWFHD